MPPFSSVPQFKKKCVLYGNHISNPTVVQAVVLAGHIGSTLLPAGCSGGLPLGTGGVGGIRVASWCESRNSCALCSGYCCGLPIEPQG